MSLAYSLAQRTLSLNSLFAGAACAIALTLTAGPALAQSSDMGRVEIRGRVVEAPVRYDVHASCQGIEDQLQTALDKTWGRERRYGDVKVQLVMENGQVSAVQARGLSVTIARDVRAAVNRLDCGPQAAADTQIYRFNVAFVDPYAKASRNSQTASAERVGIRVAQLSE